MKEREILREILSTYYDLVEKDINKGHYIETEFPHYSELVRTLVEKTKQERNALFLTALCIPPFQWYNFRISKPDAISVTEVDTNDMQADNIWTDYLKFVKSLRDEKIPIYRYIFSVEGGFESRTQFNNLVKKSVVDAQFSAFIISAKDDDVRPLTGNEIRIILGERIERDYKCYKDVPFAYLIVDEKDIQSVRIDKHSYNTHRLADHFGYFQRPGHKKDWVYTRQHSFNLSLPQDFFLFGTGLSLKEAEWHFILAADVAPDLRRVTLWFMTSNLPAKTRQANGEYRPKFDFNSIIDFINNIVIEDT